MRLRTRRACRRSAGEMEELNGLLAGALCSLAEGLIGEAAPAVETVAEEARTLLARAARLTPNSPEPLQVRCCAAALIECNV